MTKKLILILLSFLMILLPSCAEEQEFTYPKLSLTEEEKGWLLAQMEKETSDLMGERMELSNMEGNVTVAEARWFAYADQRLYERFGAPKVHHVSNQIYMVDEKDLYPNTKGKYVYLFFVYLSNHGDTYLTECVSAELSEGVLSMAFINEPPMAVTTAFTYYLAAIKIKKSSLVGEINCLDLMFDGLHKEVTIGGAT